MKALLDAILSNAGGEDLAGLPLPATYRAVCIRRSEADMFAGRSGWERDPRRSLHLEEVPVPALAPDEALIAVMASSVNFNTVWSATFEPVPTFAFLRRLGREGAWGARHDLPYHVLGSDAAGVVLRTGQGVRRWRPGDRVVVHCNYVDDQDPSAHNDSMLAVNQRIWGYESNFGGLGELAVVKANQLLPKPAHLTWEEAAVTTLCLSTAYRMLVSRNGAAMRQGDVVLVWGAAGGVGGYAVQLTRNGGGTPVGVVSSPAKVALLRGLGCEHVIDRLAAGYQFWRDEHTHREDEWRRFGRDLRALVGEDPDIVVEHPGRETMGASVFVAKRGGVVVTCAATSGFMVEFDNRQLWMKLKTVKASHFANYQEAWAANRLVCQGRIHPLLSAVRPLDGAADAVREVQLNRHHGKIGVLCLAPTEGLGVEDGALRARIGERTINAFRTTADPGDGVAGPRLVAST